MGGEEPRLWDPTEQETEHGVPQRIEAALGSSRQAFCKLGRPPRGSQGLLNDKQESGDCCRSTR